MLSREIGVDMVHVRLQGSAAYINDLIGGQVPAAVDAIADLTELHRAGKIRVLASSAPSARRRCRTCRPSTSWD
jgi:tripartite-type tricarboxylate transporter receptor subunit TctC